MGANIPSSSLWRPLRWMADRIPLVLAAGSAVRSVIGLVELLFAAKLGVSPSDLGIGPSTYVAIAGISVGIVVAAATLLVLGAELGLRVGPLVAWLGLAMMTVIIGIGIGAATAPLPWPSIKRVVVLCLAGVTAVGALAHVSGARPTRWHRRCAALRPRPSHRVIRPRCCWRSASIPCSGR